MEGEEYIYIVIYHVLSFVLSSLITAMKDCVSITFACVWVEVCVRGEQLYIRGNVGVFLVFGGIGVWVCNLGMGV